MIISKEVFLVVGVALLVYGLSGWEGGTSRIQGGFSGYARLCLALGAALTAFGIIGQRRD